MDVNLDELESWLKRQDEINKVPLRDVVWLRDGKAIQVTEKQIEDWRLVGMSNVAFAEFELIAKPDIFTEIK